MKKFIALLSAAVLVMALFSVCAFADEAAVMSWDEFQAAEIDAEVTVESYIQGKQAYSEEYGNTSLYLQDEEGAYFVYRLACTAEEYESFEIGSKIKVTGFKSEWSGEVEIADVSAFEIVEAEPYTAEAKDVTDLLGKDELADEMNRFVAFKGLTVEASDNAGTECAFLYNWDGSGEKGNDLYFNVSLDGVTFNFTVESDLCDADSDVYAAVENLKIGDKVDLEGFLYWYNGANPHITSCTAAE